MLSKDTMPFVRDLMMNNNREWFQANKPRWESVKKSFLEYTQICIDEMVKLDPSLGTPKPSQCMYRIYRDVRFSNDKRPYKAHVSFFIATGGVKRTGVPGYYVQFAPEEEDGCFMGGGIFMPDGPALSAIRQEIFYNTEEFLSIINDEEYKRWFPGGFWDPWPLKSAPKGYDKNWEYIKLLNHRNYCCMHEVKEDLVNSKDLVDYTLECFRASLKLNQFIQKAMYELI